MPAANTKGESFMIGIDRLLYDYSGLGRGILFHARRNAEIPEETRRAHVTALPMLRDYSDSDNQTQIITPHACKFLSASSEHCVKQKKLIIYNF